MKRIALALTIVLSILTLAAACGPGSPDLPSQDQPDDTQTDPYPIQLPAEPVEAAPPVKDQDPYPQPAELGGEVTLVEHDYAPAPGDEALDRGSVFINSIDILLLESFPVQVKLQLSGDLPTPCHQLRVVVPLPDDQDQIQVEVYSLVDPEMICIQVLAPFDAQIPLGDFTQGSFSVLINGEVVGAIDLP